MISYLGFCFGDLCGYECLRTVFVFPLWVIVFAVVLLDLVFRVWCVAGLGVGFYGGYFNIYLGFLFCLWFVLGFADFDCWFLMDLVYLAYFCVFRFGLVD